ncbi:hypothetical protein L218DRAFT_838319, partial [Marasmius fiardii PR-910]
PLPVLWDSIPGIEASHNPDIQFSRGPCMSGTHRTVLQLLHKWNNSECQGYSVCWLSGAA